MRTLRQSARGRQSCATMSGTYASMNGNARSAAARVRGGRRAAAVADVGSGRGRSRGVRVNARKVAVLGAAGGIGQPLSLLLAMNPLVRNFRSSGCRFAASEARCARQTQAYCTHRFQFFDFLFTIERRYVFLRKINVTLRSFENCAGQGPRAVRCCEHEGRGGGPFALQHAVLRLWIFGSRRCTEGSGSSHNPSGSRYAIECSSTCGLRARFRRGAGVG